MPSSRARPDLRPRLLAVAGLLAAVVAAVLVALAGGGDDAPSLREQYGGHGGAPAARTGAAGRVALDGAWAVVRDPSGRGADRGFHRGRFAGRRVRLPHSVNAGRITGTAGVRSHEGSVAWYRTRLRVPRSGRYAVRFESANHRATVWLDGRRVGDHVGTYLPFEVRPQLRAGRDHTLVVRVDWRSPEAMKAEAWHRAWFNFGGINREVTIRPLGGDEVLAPTVRTQLTAGGGARVAVSARARRPADADAAGDVRVTGVLRRGEQEVALRFPSVRLGRGESREVRATAELPRAAL